MSLSEQEEKEPEHSVKICKILIRQEPVSERKCLTFYPEKFQFSLTYSDYDIWKRLTRKRR